MTTVGDDIAWIKPGAGRPALRHQSRSRLLRRRARARPMKSNPNAMAMTARQLHLHQRGADRRRRRLVGGHGPEPPRARSSTGRASDWTPESASRRKAAHPNARFTAPRRSARRSIPTGRTRTACRSSAFIFGGRRATTVAARLPRRSTGRTASTWPRPWARRRPRRDSRPGGDAARPDRDAAVLRLQHGRLLRPLARSSGASGADAAAHLPRELVPHATRTASSCGRASARTCAC